MTRSDSATAEASARLANLVGAAALGLCDAMQDAICGEAELDSRAAAALVALTDFAPSATVRVISQVLGLTHSGAVRLVDRLVAYGYADRGTSANDARSVAVTLTAEGRRVAQRIRQRRHATMEMAMAGFSSQQRKYLTSACEVIIANAVKQRLAVRASGGQPAGGALCRMCDLRACGRALGRCPAAATARQPYGGAPVRLHARRAARSPR